MKRVRIVSLLAIGLVFIVGVNVALAYIGLGLIPSDQQAIATDEADNVPVEVPRSPADIAIDNGATTIGQSLKLSRAVDRNPADVMISQGCRANPDGWITANASGVSTNGANINIFVGAWRAGAGSEQFETMYRDIKECAHPSSPIDSGKYIATLTHDKAARIQGVLRQGDVVTVVNIASRNAGSGYKLMNRALNSAQKVLYPKLVGTCINPTTTISKTDDERDPFSSSYKGKLNNQNVAAPVTPLLTNKFIRSIKNLSTEPTWKPPSMTEFPDLAPFNSPNGENTKETAGRGKTPMFRNPDDFVQPSGKERSSEPMQPSLPDSPKQSATYRVQSIDETGPGCGWKFTQVQPPNEDSSKFAKRAEQSSLASIASLNNQQLDWMMNTLEWPQEQRSWARSMTNWNNWILYRDMLNSAWGAQATARANYQDSVDRWNNWTPEPSPTETPTESPSPTQSPTSTPTPTTSPHPSPTEQGGE